MWEVQDEVGLDSERPLVAMANDQMVLTGLADRYLICWRRIEALTAEPGPFVYRASRTGGLRGIDLS